MNRDVTSSQCQCGDLLVWMDESFRSRVLMRTLPEACSRRPSADTLRHWEWRNMSSKATFSTYTWRLSPLHFRMRFWSWKSGRFWLMSSFYQKQQGFLLDKVRPIRGREDLLSFWPRAQRNGTSQFKLQEAYRTLLMLFSLCRDSSMPARLAAKKF